ncbi:hypothetical protein M3Y94_00028700 [Aphelenchoides besseyi]|nr:hypothetical protein M3Y94_00028700 [Aphelenchoides besseyi]KAI6216381.1 hypothetical protein M3Y95_01280700 [Aphelenchoides besseyi]
MFRFLAVVIAVMLIVNAHAYGNNQCIKKQEEKEKRGFSFFNCSSPAELDIKWMNNQSLWLAASPAPNSVVTFKFVLNDQCTLNFSANSDEIKWTSEDGNYVNCTSVYDCVLELRSNGLLTTYDNRPLDCGNKTLRNPIENNWVWSKVHIEDVEPTLGFAVLVFEPAEGEGEEYKPKNGSSADL